MIKTKLFLTAAAGFGVLASPALAQVTGTVGAGVSHIEADAGSFDGNDDAYGLAGGIVVPMSGSLALLADVSYEHTASADTDLATGTVHLVSRNEAQAFGGYAGLVDADGDNAYVLGGEYAKFFGRSTLALAGGYGSLDDADVDLLGVNGEYRYFLSDDFRLNGGLGWTRADSNGGDADLLQFSLGGEYRIPGTAASIGATYIRAEADDFDYSSDTFALTLNFDFGNKTLKVRDRSGNTFGPLGGLGGGGKAGSVFGQFEVEQMSKPEVSAFK